MDSADAIENTEGHVGRTGGHAGGLEDLNVLVSECSAQCRRLPEDREGFTCGSRAALGNPETPGVSALGLRSAR